MNTIVENILQNLGNDGVEKIGVRAGLDSQTTEKLIKQFGPLIVSKMGTNAMSSDKLASLDTAITKDHDGSIFNNINDLVNPSVDTKGDKILSHIFGGSKSTVTKAIADKSEVSEGSAGAVMEMLGTLILGQIGKMKKESNDFDISMLGDLLSREKKNADEDKVNPLIELAKDFIDKDDDGSVTDDLLGMAKKFFK
ncbi:MAG: DUF937 domain-containing protein [Candidatus Pacebacteria bacterium]|nr:DUF937 domain-containing protein [Candidatus Paceibacterota bacterium]